MIISKSKHADSFSFKLSLYLFAFLIMPHNSYASNTVEPIGCTLDLIVNELQGNIGRAIGIIAVIMLNIRYFFGKAEWGKELLVYLGITIIFGAANIINYLAVIPITDYDQCVATANGYIDNGLTGAPGLPTNTGYVPSSTPQPGQNGYIRPSDGIPVNTANDFTAYDDLGTAFTIETIPTLNGAVDPAYLDADATLLGEDEVLQSTVSNGSYQIQNGVPVTTSNIVRSRLLSDINTLTPFVCSHPQYTNSPGCISVGY